MQAGGKGPAFTGEQPDAIGWPFRSGSHLVECKTSVGDFHSDKLKRWRADRGLGLFRWYLTPPGLLTDFKTRILDRLPAGNGQKDHSWLDYWGVAEAHPRQIRVVRFARPVPPNAWNHQAELWLLSKLCLRERRLRESPTPNP